MRKRDAKKLHNRDQVEICVDGAWSPGYVLGEISESEGRILVPVQSRDHGFMPHVDYTDIR